MINLMSAIDTKFRELTGGDHNSFFNGVVGRMYENECPDGTEFPRATYSIVSDVPENTFTEDFENVLLQFDIYSINSDTTEIKNLFSYLKSLFDNCSMTITSNTLIWMKRTILNTSIEDLQSIEGTGITKVNHYSIDYEIKMSAN